MYEKSDLSIRKPHHINISKYIIHIITILLINAAKMLMRKTIEFQCTK